MEITGIRWYWKRKTAIAIAVVTLIGLMYPVEKNCRVFRSVGNLETFLNEKLEKSKNNSFEYEVVSEAASLERGYARKEILNPLRMTIWGNVVGGREAQVCQYVPALWFAVAPEKLPSELEFESWMKNYDSRESNILMTAKLREKQFKDDTQILCQSLAQLQSSERLVAFYESTCRSPASVAQRAKCQRLKLRALKDVAMKDSENYELNKVNFVKKWGQHRLDSNLCDGSFSSQ